MIDWQYGPCTVSVGTAEEGAILMRRSCQPGLVHRSLAAAAALAAVLLSAPAQACRMHAPLKLEDVRFAELVVVGRVANYRIVRDHEFRRRMLRSPHLTPEMRRQYGPNSILMSDHARFDVLVDEVLVGTPPRRLTVTWSNSTFALPETMAAGPFVIALRRAGAPAPPLRGPSATIWGGGDPQALTLLQAPCSSAFMFAVASGEARTLRRMLGRRR